MFYSFCWANICLSFGVVQNQRRERERIFNTLIESKNEEQSAYLSKERHDRATHNHTFICISKKVFFFLNIYQFQFTSIQTKAQTLGGRERQIKYTYFMLNTIPQHTKHHITEHHLTAYVYRPFRHGWKAFNLNFIHFSFHSRALVIFAVFSLQNFVFAQIAWFSFPRIPSPLNNNTNVCSAVAFSLCLRILIAQILILYAHHEWWCRQ